MLDDLTPKRRLILALILGAGAVGGALIAGLQLGW